MERIDCRSLNREIIKYIAIFAMLLNHIAHIFLKSNTILYYVFKNAGYFTAITMCYFLVEGYMYTSSKKKYAMRLLIFAMIAQIPYMLAFKCIQFNMLFTLLFCLIFLWTKENVKDQLFEFPIYLALVILSLYSDWSVLGLVFVNSFYGRTTDKNELKKAFIFNIAIYFLVNIFIFRRSNGIVNCLMSSAVSLIMPILSAILIIYFYNGKKSARFNKFSKWFFYIFYPGHLILLVLLKWLFVYVP